MTRLVLVRHGEAAAGWTADADPGLSELGHAQARAMAEAAGTRRPIVVSPLRRTRETAAALESAWGNVAAVDDAVGEIPSPIDDLQARGPWLLEVMGRRWHELDADLQVWRARLLERLLACDVDTVIVTHFIAINAVVGAATGDDSVIVCRPANCSRTVVVHDGRAFQVVELGSDAASTRVL
jgi:broad specificity phosphatase PhoE